MMIKITAEELEKVIESSKWKVFDKNGELMFKENTPKHIKDFDKNHKEKYKKFYEEE